CENLRSQLDRHHCADSNLYCLQRTGTTSLQLLDRRVPSILPRVLHFVPWIVGPFPAIRAPSPGTRRLLDTRSNDGFTSTCTDIQLFACTKHVQDRSNAPFDRVARANRRVRPVNEAQLPELEDSRDVPLTRPCLHGNGRESQKAQETVPATSRNRTETRRRRGHEGILLRMPDGAISAMRSVLVLRKRQSVGESPDAEFGTRSGGSGTRCKPRTKGGSGTRCKPRTKNRAENRGHAA